MEFEISKHSKIFNDYFVKNLQIFTFLAPLIKSQGV